MGNRSDGKECPGPVFRSGKPGLCPQCHTDDYVITTAGHRHNAVKCSCGWKGCECELVKRRK